jgi:hypothetical protein
MPGNALINYCQNTTWVMVKGNKGGIKVETPQAGSNSPTGKFQMQGQKRL